MLNCEWASALTKYDCRQVRGIDGQIGLEIGTPFSLPDGSAINLYVLPVGDHMLLSDNGDTLFHLNSMGLDVFHSMRLRSLRQHLAPMKLSIGEQGDLRMIAQPSHAAYAFAQTITGILAVSAWASAQLGIEAAERDIVAEAEPFIIARNPAASFKLRPRVRGASQAEHVFDYQHGTDLIDVISPNAASTGGVMRKIGDVTNGPFAEHLSPLIIVDDRDDEKRANNELGIIASIARAQPFTALMRSVH
jgi:hypothetical protein